MTAPNGSLLSAPPEVRGKRVARLLAGHRGPRPRAAGFSRTARRLSSPILAPMKPWRAAGAHCAQGRPARGLRRATARPVRLRPRCRFAVGAPLQPGAPAGARTRDPGDVPDAALHAALSRQDRRHYGFERQVDDYRARRGDGCAKRGSTASSAGTSAKRFSAASAEITPDTTVILEISHTQLQYTDRFAGHRGDHEHHAESPGPVQLGRIRRPEAQHPHPSATRAMPPSSMPMTRRAEPSWRRSKAGSSVLRILEEQPGPGAWVERGEIVVRARWPPTAGPSGRSSPSPRPTQPGECHHGLRHCLRSRNSS